jgi:hypothetical protein
LEKASTQFHTSAPWRSLVAGAIASFAIALPPAVTAGEGGTTHVIPGSMATIVDNPPTAPGTFVKPMYLHYSGSISAQIPTAVGLAGDVDASANTFALAGGHTFETTVLGGAHYSIVAALPYSWLNITANVQAPGGGAVRRKSTVDGFGDLTVIPAMLAWKSGEWQFNALLPIYAPTGSYQEGRLGNPGLNYWTFDPMVGVAYSSQKGLNALLHAGYAMNTENSDTSYKSGSLLHFDGAVQQILPVGSGFMTLGAEGFYFQQVTCDSGSGAVLGCFKGRTAGIGPVLGYIQQLGKQSLSFELKWLPELDTKNRLNGDYIWLKMVYKF